MPPADCSRHPDSSFSQAELRAVIVNVYMRVVAPLGCAFDPFYFPYIVRLTRFIFDPDIYVCKMCIRICLFKASGPRSGRGALVNADR